MTFDGLFDTFLRLDGPVFQWVEAHMHPGSGNFWDSFFSIVTRLGDGGVFWIVLALVLFIPKRTRKAAAVMACALALDVVITNGILKVLFERPRPYDFNWAGSGWDFIFHQLVEKEHDFSFPSGHTGVSFAGALGLLFGAKRKWFGGKGLRIFAVLLTVLAALVGFSRIYIGVHYATDVIGGVLVGLVCAALAVLVFRLMEPLFDRLNVKLERKLSGK
ncbi:MAG: phosphatase PAP2 family protein [Oscillospiraceae bacterium]|jgi:undecaprenyl-diphosphatase|nr:phosphatase PAP2 family protein [Oscillospiraceae bacterium]